MVNCVCVLLGVWKGELTHFLLKPTKPKPLPVGHQAQPMVALSMPIPPLLDQKLNHLSYKLPALLMQN
jgi:hypothetical protein